MRTKRLLALTALGMLLILPAGQAQQPDAPLRPVKAPIAPGPFKPDWQSLSQYQCPEWYRDAKFGIWAHWSAQCQPEQGDWYAQHMYQQGHNQYNYHVQTYGHPSKFGFKDVCNAWKAEKWDPDRLMALYKRAGAQYFVALANHHCNFDLWNSRYQPWNSVNIGPKKDLIAGWERAARAQGLRFGVTVHAARSWSWYETAQGADKTGPLAGVPYDGRLTKADGAGQWWEGYDPQDLYAQNHKPGEKPDQAYVDKFFNRVIDLIDHYKPDLLYFDDGVLPLNSVSDAGLKIAAHYYNSNMAWHNGKNEAVLNTKGLNAEQRQCLVWDIERGRSDKLEPFVWQTDTCIGGWHYNISLFENHRYRTPTNVITTLIDIVSKNGNLLLNIPVKGDGTIDSDETAFLEEMAKWMAVNGEGIFGTRPWLIFGEGASDVSSGNFGERNARAYTAGDIRFTTKGDAIYAFALGWPEKTLTLRSMGRKSPLVTGEVADIRLLGCPDTLKWSRTDEGLAIEMPAAKPGDHAFAFRITGLKTVVGADVSNLPWVPKPAPAGQGGARRPAPATRPGALVEQAADGTLVLPATHAELHGALRVEQRTAQANIGYWSNAADWVAWKAKVTRPGTYEVSARMAVQSGESGFTLAVGAQQLAGKAPATGSWDTYRDVPLGRVEIKEAGEVAITLRPRADAWKHLNVTSVTLKPTK